jgi:hypothetical protein
LQRILRVAAANVDDKILRPFTNQHHLFTQVSMRRMIHFARRDIAS